MKKMFVSAMVLVSSTAFADVTLFNCTVPAQNTSAVSMTIEMGEDAGADFVTFTLNEKSAQAGFFTQQAKGTFADQIANGYFSSIIFGENFSQVDGVIVDSGLISLQKEADKVFSGVLSAKGNLYPLVCNQL
jgi:hypothetical protein